MPFMRKSVLYPALAVALGGLAAALRMWQRLSGYDASGLPVSMSIQAVTLTAVILLSAGSFVFLAFRVPKTLGDQTAALPRGSVVSSMLTASGMLLLLGGILNLIGFAGGYLEVSNALYATAKDYNEAMRLFLMRGVLSLALALVSVPAAAALLLQAKRAKKEQPGEPGAFVFLMPPFFSWVWLIEAYRQRTSNPVVWDYVLLLLAVAALLVGGYFRAGFAFGVGKPRQAVFSSLLALFFAVSALPDSGGAADTFTLLALLLQTAAELSALLMRLYPTYQPRRLAQ